MNVATQDRRHRRPIVVLVAAVFVLFVVCGMWLAFKWRSGGPGSVSQAALALPPIAPEPPSPPTAWKSDLAPPVANPPNSAGDGLNATLERIAGVV